MTRADVAAGLKGFFGSARLTSVLATTGVGLAILSWAIHSTIGWAGLIAMLATLLLLCGASVWARRDTLDRTGLLPISLLVFSGWAVISVLWSQYQWVTIGGIAYSAAFAGIGVYIALVRDTIQVIRGVGDVLRVVLIASLAIELLSGLLIDTPIAFLRVDAHLADGGPISGLLGNRNELGLLAVIGGVSFAIEWRTRSIERGLAIGSLALALLTLVFTKSPIAYGTAVVAVIVLAVLYGIRRLTPGRRPVLQFSVLGVALVGALVTWQLRTPIINALNASGELEFRLRLWRQMWGLYQFRPLEGWGWMGQWNTEVPPYTSFGISSARESTSALNGYLDVLFQLGIIGLFLFLGLAGLAFVRSWLLASRMRSVVFTWPAVVLAALLTASLAESSILFEFGWMLLVICTVKASQSLSWRNAFQRPLEQEPFEG